VDSLVFPIAEVYVGGGLIGLLVVAILVVVLLKALGLL